LVSIAISVFPLAGQRSPAILTRMLSNCWGVRREGVSALDVRPCAKGVVESFRYIAISFEEGIQKVGEGERELTE